MTAVRNALACALFFVSCEPAFACPVAAQGVSSVDIAAGCPAPFDGVLRTNADDQARAAAAADAEDALRAAAKKIRGLKAAIAATPEPPSRVKWLLAGATAAAVVFFSVKGLK